MFDTLHKAYLIAEAETICNRLKIDFETIDRNTFLVNGIKFTEYKKMLSYVYDKEAKK